MSQDIHVAIVEDSLEILQMLSSALENEGYKISTYSRAAEFESDLDTTQPDLCLVDLGLPDKDGLALIQRIGATSNAAILVISGRSSLQERVLGLELGADDYLAKPFEISEVIARVKALVRRRSPDPEPAGAETNSIYTFHGWTADFSQYLLTDDKGSQQRMSASEASLLKIFLDRANKLVTRDQLQTELGDKGDRLAFDRAIDVRVSRLRAKLSDPTRNPQIIKTIYGAGYIMVNLSTG